MVEPNECNQFDDELYDALAEVLLLGETVPAELRLLWEHTARCADCLARLEGERLWNDALRAALTRSRGSSSVAAARHPRLDTRQMLAGASLVLFLSVVAAQRMVRVVRRAAWTGPDPRVSLGPAEARARDLPRASHVEFQDFSVEVAPTARSVTVTVYSKTLAIEGLVVRVLDESGVLVDEKITDSGGSATLASLEDRAYQLAINWPDRPPGVSAK